MKAHPELLLVEIHRTGEDGLDCAYVRGERQKDGLRQISFDGPCLVAIRCACQVVVQREVVIFFVAIQDIGTIADCGEQLAFTQPWDSPLQALDDLHAEARDLGTKRRKGDENNLQTCLVCHGSRLFLQEMGSLNVLS